MVEKKAVLSVPTFTLTCQKAYCSNVSHDKLAWRAICIESFLNMWKSLEMTWHTSFWTCRPSTQETTRYSKSMLPTECFEKFLQKDIISRHLIFVKIYFSDLVLPVNVWYQVYKEGHIVLLTLSHVVDEADVEWELGVDLLAQVPVDVAAHSALGAAGLAAAGITVEALPVGGVQEVEEVVTDAGLKGVKLTKQPQQLTYGWNQVQSGVCNRKVTRNQNLGRQDMR